MLTLYPEEITRDLLRVYGIRIKQVLSGDVSPTECLILLRGLDASSELGAAVQQDSSFVGWTTERHLLAGIYDRLAELSWLTVAINSKRKPKPPKPLPRPGDKPVKPTNPFLVQLQKVREANNG